MRHFLDILHQKLTKIIDLIDSPLMLLGSFTLAQYKDFLGVIGLLITIGYTFWKWRKELKEIKDSK